MLITVMLLAYVLSIFALSVGIVGDRDLTAREALVGVLTVVAVPIVGALLWIVLWPDRAWRTFARQAGPHIPGVHRERGAEESAKPGD